MNRLACIVLLGLAASLAATPSARAETLPGTSTQDLAPRPRIIVRPRMTEPGPNAKRYCRARLVQEFRVSGTVIVPHTYCWWQ